MKVLYDHQAFSNQVYGGTSKYFYELLSRIHTNSLCDFEVPLLFSNNSYISDAPFARPVPFLPGINFAGKMRLINGLNEPLSVWKLKKQDFSVFHPTHYSTYFLGSLKRKPFVLTVYDMIHERGMLDFSRHDHTVENKRLLALRADRLIAISKNTKKDLLDFYDLDKSMVEVIHLASSFGFKPPVNGSEKGFSLPSEFILFVGTRQGYKNFGRFIRAAAGIVRERNLSVVCVGGGVFSDSEKKTLDNLGIKEKVIQIAVPERKMPFIYSKAALFVFPSLYEGFGLPILEAFSCGCPVALSRASCFPEVAGDAGVYFDPADEGDIEEKMRKVIDNYSIAKKLVRKGVSQNKLFSWEKTAKKTVKVYEKLA